MDLGIAGRVAIVTASSKGLGRGAAEALVSEGASVVITARDEQVLEATRKELSALGTVHAIPGDITEKDMPGRVVNETVERFGRLDIVVANAGGPPPGRALEISDEQVHEAVEANLVTSVRLVREALPHLKAQQWGRICCVTSRSVINPMPNLSLSNLARTGLYAWARTAAGDLCGTGVTLNLICPGSHLTDRIKSLGGVQEGEIIGDPQDFGKAVAFLCSDPARYVNGIAFLVDGGTASA